MYGYKWNYFPARLHSTKEIIYFLENISNMKEIIKNNPKDLLNCIFGDIYHNDLKKLSENFINKKVDKTTKKVILEICTRKVRYYNNIPLSDNYSSKYNFCDLPTKILTDDEIDNDLIYIVKLCKIVFNEDTEVHIIPHLNLKTKLGDYIHERSEFVLTLERLCVKNNINLHNIGKYIESIDKEACIESYMADSRHYSNSKGYAIIKQFLVERIINL